ncbi:MAG TPA: response regulator [Kofleriaceae bacterium]|nr:response regulator [Kofleriaceae bacterium]
MDEAEVPSPPITPIESVLVVDDDEAILTGWRRSIGRQRKVFTATNPDEARAIAMHERPDLAIIDLRLGSGESGIDLVKDLKADRPELRVALCSAYLSVVTAVAAVQAGADHVFFKPVTFKEILRRIEDEQQPEPDLDETPTLARIEWEHIARVLADCDGNITLAARRLGIYRSSLQRKLRKNAPRG